MVQIDRNQDRTPCELEREGIWCVLVVVVRVVQANCVCYGLLERMEEDPLCVCASFGLHCERETDSRNGAALVAAQQSFFQCDPSFLFGLDFLFLASFYTETWLWRRGAGKYTDSVLRP